MVSKSLSWVPYFGKLGFRFSLFVGLGLVSGGLGSRVRLGLGFMAKSIWALLGGSGGLIK